MRKNIKDYFIRLENLFSKVIVTNDGSKTYQLDEAIEEAIRLILKQSNSGGKLIFIGNGASAAISSHMAVDFWKNASIPALCFNDSSLLTCISNDYGYKHVFEKPVEMFIGHSDCLIAISSSGKSENILRAVVRAKKKKAKAITLSGFDNKNPLRKLGNINFYVPANHYGYVEIAHLAICHCLVDTIMESRNG